MLQQLYHVLGDILECLPMAESHLYNIQTPGVPGGGVSRLADTIMRLWKSWLSSKLVTSYQAFETVRVCQYLPAFEMVPMQAACINNRTIRSLNKKVKGSSEGIRHNHPWCRYRRLAASVFLLQICSEYPFCRTHKRLMGTNSIQTHIQSRWPQLVSPLSLLVVAELASMHEVKSDQHQRKKRGAKPKYLFASEAEALAMRLAIP